MRMVCYLKMSLYSKSLGQPTYTDLKKLLRPIKKFGYFAFCVSENILHPLAAKKYFLFIFDNVTCDNREKMFIKITKHLKYVENKLKNHKLS